MDWYYPKMYSQIINKEVYEIHRYWFPYNFTKRLKWVRKYFRVMDRDDTSHQFKRRKSGIECAETAVMVLGRLDQIIDLDIPLAVGSAYLDKKPWAVFGEAPEVDAKLFFKGFDDIVNYYHSGIVKGGCGQEFFHFRVVPSLVGKLSSKHRQTTHFIVSMAVALLYDILVNCGPDCEELHDLFTNDLRVTPDSLDLDEWQDLRCRVMGSRGRISDEPYRCHVGQIYLPSVPLTSSLAIDLITESDDLASGEKTQVITPFSNYAEEDSVDDGTAAPETDLAYQARVRNTAKKYPHLVGSLCQGGPN